MTNQGATPGQPVARRTVLRALGTAFGAAVVAGLPGRTEAHVADEAPAEPAALLGGVAIVERFHGSTVTARFESSGEVVALQARDFPPDWDFRVGDRVAVIDVPEEATPVILPFVVTTDPVRPELREDNLVSFGDIQAEVTNGTVQDAIREVAAEPAHRRYHGLLVENARTDELTAFGIVGHH